MEIRKPGNQLIRKSVVGNQLIIGEPAKFHEYCKSKILIFCSLMGKKKPPYGEAKPYL